ncbi:hypothetical protein BD311DRAFT_764277 [Dichomitus squalens]|uniref:Uncharacterized protein n=1 Tax=Dichomitus squalens TaxID=114155 RepID=A0A4Q9MGC3_9APHY|nr:hypothetical protein BD311DRAFT_764277 [Dichomitus squalens]
MVTSIIRKCALMRQRRWSSVSRVPHPPRPLHLHNALRQLDNAVSSIATSSEKEVSASSSSSKFAQVQTQSVALF